MPETKNDTTPTPTTDTTTPSGPNNGAPTGGPQGSASAQPRQGMASSASTADAGAPVTNEPAQPVPTAEDIADAAENLDDGGISDDGPFSSDEGSPDAEDYRDPETGNVIPRKGAFE